MHNSGLLKNSRVLSDQTLTYAVLLAFNKHISAQTVDLFYGLLNYSKKNFKMWRMVTTKSSSLDCNFPYLKPVSQPLLTSLAVCAWR